MTQNFNSYQGNPVVPFWFELCQKEGTLRHYDRGEYFFREDEVAPYFGFIKSGTLKYVTYDRNGAEHVMGLEFTDGFVTDFPFSFYGVKARTSVVAASPSDILCVPVRTIRERMRTDNEFNKIIGESTGLVFGMVYDRYKDLYTLTPQERYEDLISKHPDLFSLFSLRDIASFLKITPTHLSRLRKNI